MDFDTNDSINPEIDDLLQDDGAKDPAVDVRVIGSMRTHKLPARVAHTRNLTISASTDPALLEHVANEDLRREYLFVSVTGQPVFIGHDKQMVADGTSGILPVGSVLALPTSEPAWARAAGGPSTSTVTTVPGVTVGADPAANTQAIVTVPAGETWELESVRLSLVTSAAAANRRVTLVIDDGVNILAEIVAGLDQIASLTIDYTYTADAGYETVATRSGVIQQGIPRMLLAAGYRIRTLTDAMDVGDNYSAPVIGYRKTTTATTAAGSAVLSYWSGNWAD